MNTAPWGSLMGAYACADQPAITVVPSLYISTSDTIEQPSSASYSKKSVD